MIMKSCQIWHKRVHWDLNQLEIEAFQDAIRIQITNLDRNLTMKNEEAQQWNWLTGIGQTKITINGTVDCILKKKRRNVVKTLWIVITARTAGTARTAWTVRAARAVRTVITVYAVYAARTVLTVRGAKTVRAASTVRTVSTVNAAWSVRAA